MYTILGGDQQQYGPVDQAGVMLWIQNGQATAVTMVFKQGSAGWVPLSSLPEFAGALAGGMPGAPMGGVKPAQKSNTPKVFGILHIVFGVFCELCFGLSLLGTLMESEVDGVAIVLIGLLVLTNLLLIIAGIGLLMYRSWGATMSVAYGILGIILALGNTATALFSPDNPFTNSGRGGGAEMAGFGIGMILALGALTVYPIVTLIFMRKPSVKDALN